MRALTFRRAAAIAVGVLALAACGDSGDSGIARLSADATATPSASADSGTAEEQALAFAQCMRDNGVDFPDPTVDSEGNLSFEGAFGRSQDGGFDPGDTSFRDAQEACGDLMEGMVMGGGMAGGAFDSTAMQESMLAYTECLRTEGLDVGDLTFDGPGLRADDVRATRERVDLADVAAEAVSAIADAAARRGISVSLDLADAPVDGDTILLSRMAHNALENAVKYNLPDQGEIACSTYGDDRVSGLRISNTGPTISAEELPRLFERFERGEARLEGGGHGLGLPIIRRVAEAHDGSVTAVPRPGGGLVVTVSIPRASDAS